MESETKLRCPRCGGGDTRHSVRGGPLDAIMRLFGRRPFRCRGCRFRFYRREEKPVEEAVHETDIEY